MTKLVTPLLFFLTAMLPAVTLAADQYVTDRSGQVVHDGFGSCVKALYHGKDFPECRGETVARAPVDSDNDGVSDDRDRCPGTPPGTRVDSTGCPLDTDGDGVADNSDRCPGTPANVTVDAVGCPLDKDRDGVANYLDQCPNTPLGSTVDAKGCPLKIVVRDLNFSNDSAALRPASITTLEGVVVGIKDNPAITQVTVTGYTDSSGSEDYNKVLSERRASAVAEYLRSRLGDVQIISVGMGEANPIASNATREGRAQNRRVEIDLK